MTAVATSSRQVIEEYIAALSGAEKTEAVIDRYVADPALKAHIEQAEAAFPGYRIDVDQLLGEGDTVALRGTFRGIHKGTFAGVEATGKEVSAGLMLFYKLADGRIVEHWMQWDALALMQQLQG
jgi:predicted ester cyclase